MRRDREPSSAPRLEGGSSDEAAVLDTVRALLSDLGSGRALAALRVGASLERDLGLGSLERVELLARLETDFAVELSAAVLAEAETVSDLVRAVRRAPHAQPGAPSAAARSQLDRLPAPSVSKADTLVELIRTRGERESQRPHIYLQGEDPAEEAVLTYGSLYRDALEIGGGLSGIGVRLNEAVALMLPTGRDFFTAFAGILLAGAVPVPLYPPFNFDRIADYARRQARILRNCGARALITVSHGRSLGHLLGAEAPALERVTTVEELCGASRRPPDVEIRAESPALIQYTSGSTGDPKGVLLSHRSLVANIRAIGEALALAPGDVGVSWLPLYHDMGLIGCWMAPLYYGFPVVILSPLSFLSRPERWLWAIHSHRATLSAAPNFGYELCVRRVRSELIEGLDLSSWRGALNGAEPISIETIEAFTHRFSRFGFPAESMTPVYGLAESSLALSVSPLDRRPRIDSAVRETFETTGRVVTATGRDKDVVRFVSCGRPIRGHQIRIVDERGEEQREGVEGRLLFRGPSTMEEYFRNPEATQAVMKADGWVDSGDRAFVLDGEVFVTGRGKDIIIRAGRNLHPQEIEDVVGDVDGVRRGCVAAFGVPDRRHGTEKVVVLAETRRDDEVEKEELERAIRERLMQVLDLPAEELLLVPPRTIPKTSSGKLRRSECRDRYRNRQLGPRGRAHRLLWVRLWLIHTALLVRKRLGRLAQLTYGSYVLLVAAALLPPMWITTWVVPSRKTLAKIVRAGIRCLLFLAGAPLRVRGLEHLEGHGRRPWVLVANHASYIDPLPLLAAVPQDFAFVVKKEALGWPLLGRIIACLGHVPVDRTDVVESVAGTQRLHEVLSQGRSVCFFPEGTFTRSTGLRPFKLGAFRLAADFGSPVVPLALVGTRRMLRDGTWLPRYGPLEVVVNEPLPPGSAALSEIVRLRDEAAERIAAHVGEPRLDLFGAALGSR